MDANDRALIQRARESLNGTTRAPWKDEAGYNNAGIPTRFFYVPGHNGGASVEMIAEDSAFIVTAREIVPALADIAEQALARAEKAEAEARELTRVRDDLLTKVAENGRDAEHGRLYEKALRRIKAELDAAGSADKVEMPGCTIYYGLDDRVRLLFDDLKERAEKAERYAEQARAVVEAVRAMQTCTCQADDCEHTTAVMSLSLPPKETP